ncbi:hypothetical protein F3Y22_tig00112604pilonHSYRG00030 [Hibiscus syriacus]|uniref:Uncharacterized protein n=1 Tax=Hibiscus syriacus TaxID=106335 RepID=A0A6A2WVX3_HIBSY|nr:hypothetical protein F3Y22_tig00112604pilonHSYRG00030 [Hibiscus syriacus]
MLTEIVGLVVVVRVVAFIATTVVAVGPVRRGGLVFIWDVATAEAARKLSAAAWKLGRRRVALGYQTLGFPSGAIWTVGSCQIQRCDFALSDSRLPQQQPPTGSRFEADATKWERSVPTALLPRTSINANSVPTEKGSSGIVPSGERAKSAPISETESLVPQGEIGAAGSLENGIGKGKGKGKGKRRRRCTDVEHWSFSGNILELDWTRFLPPETYLVRVTQGEVGYQQKQFIY